MRDSISCHRNLTFLYPVFADQDLLVLNKADLLRAGREGLQVSGEGTRLSERLATQGAAIRPLICKETKIKKIFQNRTLTFFFLKKNKNISDALYLYGGDCDESASLSS